MLFFIRLSLVLFLLCLNSLFYFVIFLFRPFHPENSYLFTRTLRPLVYKILGIQVIYQNLEQLEKSTPCIFIGNHQNSLDLFLFGCTVPKRTVAVGKRSLVWIPFFGQVFWLSGQFLINRKHHASAMKTMAKVKKALLEENISLLIMPEGTRNRGKGLGPFKKGAFHLAIEAGVPLQPLVASDLHQAIQLNRWKAGIVLLKALDPIPTAGKTLKDMDELMALTRQKFEAAMGELEREKERMVLSPP